MNLRYEVTLWAPDKLAALLARNYIAITAGIGVLLCGWGLQESLANAGKESDAFIILNGIYLAVVGLVYQFRYLDLVPKQDTLYLRPPHVFLWFLGGVLAGTGWGSVTITVGIQLLLLAVLMIMIANVNKDRAAERAKAKAGEEKSDTKDPSLSQAIGGPDA